MNKKIPLVDKEYLLQKFPGKGGWTFAAIPEVLQNKNNPFGWVKVKGFIDDYELSQYKLMPMRNAQLFLPVKAKIRKLIGKEAGDYVKVTLFSDDSKLVIPQEILDCFEQESEILFKTFVSFTEGEQKSYVDWIYKSKTDETKANRIAKMMSRIQNGMRFHDKE